MLRIDDLTIRAGDAVLIDALSLTVAPDGITCLIGPSGCGKTSVIKWLAGILDPALEARGTATRDGAPLNAPDAALAYQPQQDALFPWLTVAENAGLGLEMRGQSRRAARARTAPLFAPFGLSGCEDRFPSELSGGMRQRAAFLRTIVQDTRFILLDEPFSALDAVTRLRMQDWLCARLTDTPRGVLMVTHDLHEATQMADRILVMSARPGRIVTDIPLTTPRAARTEAALADTRSKLRTLLLEETS
ncbi:ABC transporter ATP-binding protein [Psychromarinibacter halotolerans]|uniref:ABC transporter ATP-binding protein n=1 Tax=Psychromarinibacter halotolerans TaxID=1775175 RepID=A0ABV7GW73_9RHOB|nr:ABC transporter ATP-binding protein [Psychromarinibacter halotolerans]MDF0595280.1 ABC transporter ATP-binding protein [Psychromarinibacter halotolerans]